MRAVVAVFGAICVGLVFVVEKMGSVLQLSMSLGSVSNGPLLGIFTLGVLVPWANGTVRYTFAPFVPFTAISLCLAGCNRWRNGWPRGDDLDLPESTNGHRDRRARL